ncbi:MAG: (d)CMP kinase [Candidatus Methylomirabilia bacterium]
MITIDGPAGAGKSTAARELARQLGFRLVDTGAMYRALALRALEAGVEPSEGPELRTLLAESLLELRNGRILLNGRDISDEIRTPKIGALTSRLTTLPSVREKATPIQRELASGGGVVLEGRDTGSVVCPEADLKFFLDASQEVRVLRRMRDLEGRGTPRGLDEVTAELDARDRQDWSRELAPLVIPEGATVIDSTNLSVNQVVQHMLAEVERFRCSTRS